MEQSWCLSTAETELSFCGDTVAQPHKTSASQQKMLISLPIHNSDQTRKDFLRFASPVNDGEPSSE